MHSITINSFLFFFSKRVFLQLYIFDWPTEIDNLFLEIHSFFSKFEFIFRHVRSLIEVNLQFSELISHRRPSLWSRTITSCLRLSLLLNHSIFRIKSSTKNPVNLVISPHSALRSVNISIRCVSTSVPLITIWLRGTTRASVLPVNERKNTYIYGKGKPSAETDRATFAKYLLLSRFPSLLSPQSSHCRSIERSREPLIEVGQGHAFPAVLSFVSICFEITFNLACTILSLGRTHPGAHTSTMSNEWLVVTSDNPPWHNTNGD